MKITRENHASFMFKAIPLISLAYFFQAFLYFRYVPSELAQEVVSCMGLGLVGVFIYYLIHDRYHKIIVHPTYLEILFNPLQISHQIFYREIIHIEVIDAKRSFHHVIIHLKSGAVLKLAHVDDAYNIRKYLLERA
jgi:hypothetical protein